MNIHDLLRLTLDRLGLMLKSDHVETCRAYNTNRVNQEKRHEREMAASAKAISDITDRIAQVRWDRAHTDRGSYMLSISLDGCLLAAAGRDRASLEWVARDMGARVQREVLVSKFVEPPPDPYCYRKLNGYYHEFDPKKEMLENGD